MSKKDCIKQIPLLRYCTLCFVNMLRYIGHIFCNMWKIFKFFIDSTKTTHLRYLFAKKGYTVITPDASNYKR